MVKKGKKRITITLDQEHLKYLFEAQAYYDANLDMLFGQFGHKSASLSDTIQWLLEIVDY